MCVDLESIMLSEVSQRKTNTLCYLYVESKKKKNEWTQQKQTHSYREQTSGYQ